MADEPQNETVSETVQDASVAENSAPPSPPPPPAPSEGEAVVQAANPAHTGPFRLLIVDDEANFREIMSVKFKAAGFDAAVASSGKEATALLAKGEFAPDLVLMDINMPGETGTDVALMIKQDPKFKDLRIAFLTNLKEPWPAIAGDREKVAQELGMEDFLEKTDDLDDLVKRVKGILGIA